MLPRNKAIFVFLVTLAVQTGSAATLSGGGCVFLDGPSGGLDCDAPSVSSSFGSAPAGKQLTGDARGMSGYTQLSVASSADFSISETSSTAWSFASAFFDDSITINSSALDGSSGQLFLSYALDGRIVTSGAGSASVEVAIHAGPGFQAPYYWIPYTSSTSG